MLGLAHRGFSMARPEYHLVNYLRTQGYHTALAGVQHEFPREEAKPYDTHIDVPVAKDPPWKGGEGARIRDLSIAEGTRRFLLSYDRSKPFFVSCGFGLPHRAFPDAPLPDPDAVAVPSCLPDTPEVRKDMAAYHAAVASLDLTMGIVLDTLRETGLDRETLVIVTTDHGIAFPMMKCNLTDAGLGVMLMVHYPGNPAAGQTSDALVSHLDVYPTICDLAGLPAPAWLQGHSMRPLFQQPRQNRIRNEVFGEVTYHAGYEPMRCIRTNRYKLIKIFDEERRPNPVNCDDSPSKAVVEAAGWFDQPRDGVQLYDLLQDPGERRNLTGDPAYREVRNELEARLQGLMSETGDPLLAGPVPAPAGAKINTRDQRTAKAPAATAAG
jgi:arylsulfatase A-like enzyme